MIKGLKKILLSSLFPLLGAPLCAQKLPWPAYNFTLNSTDSSGYYFIQALKTNSGGNPVHPCQMIVNGKGELVYVKEFSPGEWSGNFQVHENGLMSYNNALRLKTYLMDERFKLIDSVSAKNGYTYDFHDFQILKNGNYLFLATETIKMDLSKYPYFNKKGAAGSDTAKVLCWIVQELDKNKNVVFEWNSHTHYNIEDMDTFYLSKPHDVDIVHLNSVEYDTSGYYLVSARNYNEVSKIRKSDGKLVWRFGGKRNQFRFVNDSNRFIGQHSARITPEGHLLLLDNGRDKNPKQLCSAKEYRLNEKDMTATLLWSYTYTDSIYSTGYGNVQKTTQGNYLVAPGRSIQSASMFQVVDVRGKKIAELQFKDSLKTYRAFYYSQLPWQLDRPQISRKQMNGKPYLIAPEGHKNYIWSTGETTRMIEVKQAGTYQVFVPYGIGGYLSSETVKIIPVKKIPQQAVKKSKKIT